MSVQPTCEDRIDAHKASRMVDWAHATEHIEQEEGCDQCDDYTHEEGIMEGVLSVEKSEVYCICFSTGGPADYLELEVRVDGVGHKFIFGARYLFQNWYDGAQRELSGTELDTVIVLFGHLVEDS